MLFSIITPVYQVEKYIHQCIDSVLSQTYKDFEFILVDDGSKDGSSKIIDEYGEIDNRIKIIHKDNGGATSARKAGLAIAKGEYIVLLDSDDWLEKNYLEEMSRKIKKTGADMVCCGVARCYDNGNRKKKELHSEEWDDSRIQNHCENELFHFPFALSAKAIRRELYSVYQLKVNDMIEIGEDLAVVCSMLPKCKHISFIGESLYNYRIHEFSITHDRSKINSAEAVVERVTLLADNLSQVANIDGQLATYACHAYFNSCLSYFRNYRFHRAKKLLAPSYNFFSNNHYFQTKLVGATRAEKIARFLLKHRMFGIIRIIGDLRQLNP